MKKFLSAIFCALAFTGAMSAAGLTRATVVEHLDSCEAILRDLQGDLKTAIPADILRRAKGIVIVNQFQASFIFGIKDGYATAFVRRPNGKWSVPAFLKAGELSVGFQLGGKSVTSVLVLMDDSAARLLLKSKMNFGADAKVAAGIRTAESERVTKSIVNEPNVYIYSQSEGLYAGATIKTGYMSPYEESNRLFYNSNIRLPELLFSDWITPPPEARFLMDFVARITQ